MTIAYTTPEQPRVHSSFHLAMTWLPSALVMTIVWISFRPFTTQLDDVSAGAPGGGGGDIVNQIGFGILGLVCGWMLMSQASQQIRNALKNPVWFLVLAVLVLSVAIADSPGSAIRAMVFSIIVVFAAMTALAMPRTMDSMVLVLSSAAMAAVVFCYVAVFFVPSQGVHGSSGFESQHAGLWRGVYDHKNVAAYVMGAFAMIGLFCARNGRPVLGILLCVLSILFVINAGSKTVLGILPVAFATAGLAHWISWRPLKAFVILLPVAGLATATLGAVLYPPILEKLWEYIPGLSYTGRTDLWIFGLEYLQKTPWLGYGFESFWGTTRVTNLEQPIELNWDVRGIVHGHNSWLDAMIFFGIPGALVVGLALVVSPIVDYLRIPPTGNAGRLASLFMGIWIFTALGANLESFFFRRADPFWFCMLIAIIGLRITAHITVTQRRNAGRPIPMASNPPSAASV